MLVVNVVQFIVFGLNIIYFPLFSYPTIPFNLYNRN